MNPEVSAMLEGLSPLFLKRFCNPESAWDRMIEFIAVDNCFSLLFQLGHKFEWLFQDPEFAKNLANFYDRKLLSSDYYDHLGDLYHKNVFTIPPVAGNRDAFLPVSYTDLLPPAATHPGDKKVAILDPSCRTGKRLLAAHKEYPDAMLFGVEPDIRLFRICLANCVIHSIPCYLLNADPKLHDIDIATENGQYNWQFANSWNSHSDKLRPLSPIPGHSQQCSNKSITPAAFCEQ